MIALERASQKEKNGANFSFIAPSSEELWARHFQIYAHGKGRQRGEFSKKFECS